MGSNPTAIATDKTSANSFLFKQTAPSLSLQWLYFSKKGKNWFLDLRNLAKLRKQKMIIVEKQDFHSIMK